MNDYEIITLYFERDENAISETAKKYGAYCSKIANNLLGCKEDVEECLNDMYHHAWNAIPPARPEHLGAWLSKIIRNLALDLRMKKHAKKRYAGLEEIFDEIKDCIPSTKLVEHEIEEKELTTFINMWVKTLSLEDRVLFLRRYWMGYSLKELEKEYQLSHGKLAKRMYNLRANLRKALEKEGYSL